MTVTEPHRVQVPFACETDDGVIDESSVVKKRATQCALSRICGICAKVLTRPVAFVGTEAEAKQGVFAFPPLHLPCAQAAAGAMRSDTAALGHPADPGPWALVTTGGFDLLRPSRRGDPVHFHPNSVIDTTWYDAG